jgi:two-component system copper resistance phosphate regulon response regulator CusR
MATLLLIEDEAKTAAFLQQGLVEYGYKVTPCHDGLLGYQKAKAEPYDLLILDIMLPGMAGWDIIRELRAEGISTPVLCLTARDDISDRVEGLRLGADDYLVKPS